jgi:hypothetical protein
MDNKPTFYRSESDIFRVPPGPDQYISLYMNALVIINEVSVYDKLTLSLYI